MKYFGKIMASIIKIVEDTVPIIKAPNLPKTFNSAIYPPKIKPIKPMEIILICLDFYCMSELRFKEELLKGAARFLDEMDCISPIKFKSSCYYLCA